MLSSVPGYAEAVEREKNNRVFPFLGVHDSINGIEVAALTPSHLVLLDGCGSPYIYGLTDPDPARIAQFLWVVQPDFAHDASARDAFVAQHKDQFTPKTADAITEYLTRHLQDAPTPEATAGETKSYFSWCAALVDLFAGRYGWSVEYIMSRPFALLYQLLDAAAFRANPDHLKINPSDAVISAHLKSLMPPRSTTDGA